jgi:hypothetical protein
LKLNILNKVYSYAVNIIIIPIFVIKVNFFKNMPSESFSAFALLLTQFGNFATVFKGLNGSRDVVDSSCSNTVCSTLAPFWNIMSREVIIYQTFVRAITDM